MQNLEKSDNFSRNGYKKINWDEVFALDEPLSNDKQQQKPACSSRMIAITDTLETSSRIAPTEQLQMQVEQNNVIDHSEEDFCFDSSNEDVDSGLFSSFESTNDFSTENLFDWTAGDCENLEFLSNDVCASVELSSAAVTYEENEHSKSTSLQPLYQSSTYSDAASAMLFQQISNVPQSVMSLYSRIKENWSDHALVYAISAQMCQTVLPMDAYVSLKLSLLLSIVSIQSSTDLPPVSIMAVGPDSSSIYKIMNLIGECAQRFILPANDLRESRSKYGSSPTFNSLLLARRGVCYIGDWLGLQPATSKYIRKVLDSGRIPVENSSIGEPVQCAIWSFWSCYWKNMKKNINELTTVLGVFGVPILLEENESDSIVDFLLEMAIRGDDPEPDPDFYVGTEDMKQFLFFIGNQNIEVSEEAENLLKLYFLATRSLRPAILTQRSYLILRQFAECHARLCIRRVVLKHDAIASIFIAEKYIIGIFGSEQSTAPPQMLVTNIEEVDNYMQNFENWLYGYINGYMNMNKMI